MKLVDSSILLHAVNLNAPEHRSVRRWWTKALSDHESIGFSWIVVLSFLRVATHPRVFETPLTIDDALRQMDEWMSKDNISIVEEMDGHWSIIAELLAAAGTGGNLVTDAHLAVLAISHGATLYSCDNDFARFPKLRWKNPLLK